MQGNKNQNLAKIIILALGLLIIAGALSFYLFNMQNKSISPNGPEQPYTGMLFASVYTHLFLTQSSKPDSPMPNMNPLQSNLLSFHSEPSSSKGSTPQEIKSTNSPQTTKVNAEKAEKTFLQDKKSTEKDIIGKKDPFSTVSQQTIKASVVSSAFVPTRKEELMAMAKQLHGKTNPFEENSVNSATNTKKIPKPSLNVKFDKLPEIFLPNTFTKNTPNPGGTLQIDMPPAGIPEYEPSALDKIKLSGLVGNSVIVSLDGKNRSLRVGETFNKIRLLSINGSSATFQEGGDIQVKYLSTAR